MRRPITGAKVTKLARLTTTGSDDSSRRLAAAFQACSAPFRRLSPTRPSEASGRWSKGARGLEGELRLTAGPRPAAGTGRRHSRPMARATGIDSDFTHSSAENQADLGAKLGANSRSLQATPGHHQLLSTQLNDLTSDIGRHAATVRRCLLSSGSRVRILPGAPDPYAAQSESSLSVEAFHNSFRRRPATFVPDAAPSPLGA